MWSEQSGKLCNSNYDEGIMQLKRKVENLEREIKAFEENIISKNRELELFKGAYDERFRSSNKLEQENQEIKKKFEEKDREIINQLHRKEKEIEVLNEKLLEIQTKHREVILDKHAFY